MAVPVRLQNLRKAYGPTVVLPDVNLEVQRGEFFTLLGPSGCGKTTLLRMIAGFNTITGGTIAFGDKVINDLAPAKRNIGMVFQNYAVFPHMTVRGNIAFGLHRRGLGRAEIIRRTDQIMDVVHITDFADQYPRNLSGGQQQRVALARSIVIEPSLLLMDEPLSNLDAKLRIEMRQAIRDIQREVGITTIYVTHDQEEAMAVSDRIAVMNKGNIEHLGRPREVFLAPESLFVAQFIGRTNVLDCVVALEGGQLSLRCVSGLTLPVPESLSSVLAARAGEDVVVTVRPQDVTLVVGGAGSAGEILSTEFLGQEVGLRIKIGESAPLNVSTSSALPELATGAKVRIAVEPERINVYDRESGRRISAVDRELVPR